MKPRVTMPAPRRGDREENQGIGGCPGRFRCRNVLAGLHLPLLFFLALSAVSANTAPTPALDDWRQLWGREAWQSWEQRPETELKKLAAENQPAAQYMLWWKWRQTRKTEARAMLDSAVKAGLPQAVHWRGSSLFSSASESLEKRIEGWAMMESAADKGYPPARIELAQYEAGFVTTSGYKVKPNLNRALEYFRDGVAAGIPRSMTHLALLYSSGIGEPRSEQETPHRLLLSAAERGNTDAMVHLSDRYAIGHGERPDALDAARWLFLARQNDSSLTTFADLADAEGNAKAQDTLAMQEVASAYSLFVKAVERQDAGAAIALAKRYQERGKIPEAAVLLTFAKGLGGAEVGAEATKLEAALPSDRKRSAAELFPFLK